MPTLTEEQLQKAETMSLDELRAAAIQEAEESTKPAVVDPEPSKTERNRDESGRFASSNRTTVIDNSADPEEEELSEEAAEPKTTIYRKEIENGDGSVDVYEAESLEELVDKIAEGKRNANKKIQEFIAERKTTERKSTQVEADEAYVLGEKLKKNPTAAIEEVVLKTLSRQQQKLQQAQDVQSRFVTTHPLYVANPENGQRLVAWLQTNGYTEMSYEGLEKAYQDLSKSRLLELRSEEAGAATDGKTEETHQTGETKVETTQQRSQKRSSNISTRGSQTVTRVNVQPSEDEAYQMPLEKLRELANKQLAANRE